MTERASIPVHRRMYDCEAFAEGHDRLRVRGHLADTKPLGLGVADGEPLTIHDMAIELVITVPEFEIVDVESSMTVHPYDVCPAVLVDYRQLIGMSVTRGFSKNVRELFGGPNGCSHMGALLLAMGPVAIQASWGLQNLHQSRDELLNENTGDETTDSEAEAGERERRVRMNANTCHVWSEDGDHITAVAAGEAPARPAWQQTRFDELAARSEGA